MFRDKLEPKGVADLTVAGRFVPIDLTTGVQNRRLVVEVRATATVANQDGAATARNRGSILAAIMCALSESGKDTWQQIDPRVMRFASGINGGAALTQTRTRRLTTTDLGVNGAYNLVEQFTVDFGNPRGVSWRETAYLEANSAQRFQFRSQLVQAANTRLFDDGAGATTLALSDVQVEVWQDYAIAEGSLPYLKPVMTVMQLPVPGAAASLRQLILTQNRLRAMIVQQDAGVAGEVSDIINGFVLRADNGDIVGPGVMDWDAFRAMQSFRYSGLDTQVGALGGDDFSLATTPGYAYFDFQPNGRLSELLYPNVQSNNLRFEFDCQPSASGAADSVINVILFELSRPPAVSGKNVVTETLPSFLTR